MSGAHKNYPINEDGSRICIKCTLLKEKESFKPYIKSVCYDCILKSNREKFKQKIGRPLKMPKEYLITGFKKCTDCQQNKEISEFRKITNTSDRLTSKCKVCENKRYMKYERENKDKINAKRRERRKDPCRGIIFSLRGRQKSLFKSTGNKKFSEHTSLIRDWLGCTIDECKKHLEKQFRDEMNWSNRGTGMDKWQIDHIIPISLSVIENGLLVDNELNRKIWHYTNLQPLWHPENAQKSNKYDNSELSRFMG